MTLEFYLTQISELNCHLSEYRQFIVFLFISNIFEHTFYIQILYFNKMSKIVILLSFIYFLFFFNFILFLNFT